MLTFPVTVVLRHRLENLKKCSLRGLEERPDFKFYTYPCPDFPAFSPYIILAVDAPPLTKADQHCGLLVIDATWRHAHKMIHFFSNKGEYIYRSLPAHYRTAYPRRQEDCPDPERGLASIEAIYLSYQLMERDTTGLLDNYYWKEKFLILNGLN